MRDVYTVAHLPENFEQLCAAEAFTDCLRGILSLLRSSLVLLGRMLVLMWRTLACRELVL